MNQYIAENVRTLKKNFLRKEKKDAKVIDGLFEATDIYQRCLSNIYTEFLADDGKFLSQTKVLHYFKD